MGMAVPGFIRSKTGHAKQKMRLTKRDLPYTLGIVALDIATLIFLPFLRHSKEGSRSGMPGSGCPEKQ